MLVCGELMYHTYLSVLLFVLLYKSLWNKSWCFVLKCLIFTFVVMASQRPSEDPQVTPEVLLNAMKDMMQMIVQHREEMSKHSEGQQNTINSPPSQPDASSKVSGETVMQKLQNSRNLHQSHLRRQ